MVEEMKIKKLNLILTRATLGKENKIAKNN